MAFIQKSIHRLPEPENKRIEDSNAKNYLISLIKTIRLRFESLEHNNFIDAQDYTHVDVTTTPFDVDTDAHVLLVDTTNTSIIINLPPAGDVQGQFWQIKKADSSSPNTITINPNASETIDFDSDLILSGNKHPSAFIFSDGTEWWIL